MDGRRRGFGVRGWGGRGEGLRRAPAGAARLPARRGARGSGGCGGVGAREAWASPAERTLSPGARPFGLGRVGLGWPGRGLCRGERVS